MLRSVRSKGCSILCLALLSSPRIFSVSLTSIRTDFFDSGRYMGGTLATSLALTECNKKKPGSISALATESALLDWSQFATDAPIPENYPSICLLGDNERSIAATKLRETSVILRNLFSSPAECYDPFASPILFFRNPAQNVPEEFYNIEPIDPWPSFEHISSYLNLQTHRSGRRALVRFPPRESDLVIRMYNTVSRKISQSGFIVNWVCFRR